MPLSEQAYLPAPAGLALQISIAKARRLLEEVLRPEFRADVVLAGSWALPGALRGPECDVPDCQREVRSRGLCNGHRVRWDVQGRPDLTAFKAATSPTFRGHHPLDSCRVSACRSGRSRRKLCARHFYAWTKAGQPEQDAWLTGVMGADDQGPGCRLPTCQLVAEASGYCVSHEARWVLHGRPAAEEFTARVLNYGDAKFDFCRLPEQVRQELQYALQCRHDSQLGFHTALNPLTRVLLRSGAASLLERTRAGWDATFVEQLGPGRVCTNARAFLGYAVDMLADLVHGAGWENEYPRDVWELHRLGLHPSNASRRLIFTGISQLWLRELAKKWIRWRITVDQIAASTAAADLLALRRLSEHLAATSQAADVVEQLTRPVLETFIRHTHQQPHTSATTRDRISALAVFLRQLREHEDWAPGLPRTANVYPSDYPRSMPLQPRGLSVHVMTQVHAALPTWNRANLQAATRLMIGSGLRSGDALNLPFDCIARDQDGHPFVHYWNHKMRREAFVPIDEVLLGHIHDQQERVAQAFTTEHQALLSSPAPTRYPAAGLRLFPAPSNNPRGHRPVKTPNYNAGLQRWVTASRIIDETGRPVRITSHQWRHTYATGLINAGVRLEHVRHLLDHVTMDMTQHYARLHDQTVRTAWEAANSAGQTAGAQIHLRQEDSAAATLADASWANRARTALPNGHCGLPRHQTCPHSNKCLSCPVFITTAEDLPVHQAHRARTAILIEQLERRGLTKPVEENRRVLTELDRHITAHRPWQDPNHGAGIAHSPEGEGAADAG